MLTTRRRPTLLPLLVSVSLALFAPASAALGGPPSELDGVEPAASGQAALVYTVQVGAFATRANAATVMAELGRIPADGVIAVSGSDDESVYRVLSGVFETEAAAQAHSRVLAAHGFRTYVRRASASELVVRGTGLPDAMAPTSAAVDGGPDRGGPAAAAETAELAAGPVPRPRTRTRPAAESDADGDSQARALKLLVDSIESGRRSALAAGLEDEPGR